MHGLNAKGTISLDGDMAGLESAMKKLLRMLQTVSGYVDDVVVCLPAFLLACFLVCWLE